MNCSNNALVLLQKIVLCFTLLMVMDVRADHASATFQTGSAGAIVTSPASTLPAGKWVTGTGVQFIELDDVPDAKLEAAGAAKEDVHSVDTLLSIDVHVAYGLADDLTVGFSVPYIDRSNVREAHHDTGAGEVELAGDAKGVGDLRLFGLYRFFRHERQDAAIMAGLKAPTGDTGERELEGGLFEAEQQPGSGSWDLFFGLSWDRTLGKLGLSASMLYTFVNEGTQQTDLGDVFNYNLAANYRVFSPEGDHNHHSHDHGFGLIDYVDAVVELNGDYRERVEINDINDDNSGGHTLYLSPGVRIGLGHKWSVYTSVGIPVLNDLNGIQSEPDYRLIGGISASF
ncbi:MAG TPA: transporter [Gammaproteobacteria bacterium]|nr:transporter [Gammaproteobacteria bacterium]